MGVLDDFTRNKRGYKPEPQAEQNHNKEQSDTAAGASVARIFEPARGHERL
jgi:hypothetical protein